MRWYDTCIFVFIIIVAGSTSAQAIDETADRLKVEAYRSYYGKDKPLDVAKALQLYRQAAERGDAEAQFIVGGMFYLGKGTEADKKSGFKWLLSAAEQGKTSPESLNIIGGELLRGTNVPQNYLEAKKWLTAAAAQGDLAAQKDLAYLYLNGQGGEQDYKKAFALYEKAAMQGDGMAQANIGLMYATGTGVNVDKVRGYAWYSLAANAGTTFATISRVHVDKARGDARYSLAVSVGTTFATISRKNVMLDMTRDELNQAQAISLALYERIEKIAQPEPFKPNAARQ